MSIEDIKKITVEGYIGQEELLLKDMRDKVDALKQAIVKLEKQLETDKTRLKELRGIR